MKRSKLISIVMPAYNEAGSIQQILSNLQSILSSLDYNYEILVVDDHSSDDTYQVVSSLNDPAIQCIRLSRRVGSNSAIRAGYLHAKGDCALFLSADGQEQFTVIKDMILRWQNNAQIIWALRESRQEFFLKKFIAEFFYKIITYIIKYRNKDIDLSKVDFFLLDRKVIDSINECKEQNTSLLGLTVWLGFKQDYITYNRQERQQGRSKWSFSNRLNLAFDWIFGFSALPLKITTYLGFSIAFVAFIYALFIIKNAFDGHPILGWSSLIVIILFLCGLQMIMLGVIGEYLWRNLDETRKRPLYFIEESTLED